MQTEPVADEGDEVATLKEQAAELPQSLAEVGIRLAELEGNADEGATVEPADP